MKDTASWAASPTGRQPVPLAAALALAPVMLLWTLPQTVVGLLWAVVRRAQGFRCSAYQFGPFVYCVVPAPGPLSTGISLGLVVFVDRPAILKHEFCHLLTGCWLSWLYLPVYGVEYAFWGHDQSPHERLTCAFEERLSWGWRRLGKNRRVATESIPQA